MTSVLSDKIKRYMQEYDCNAAELARNTGVPPQTLTRLLSSKTIDPKTSTLQSIAEYFNTTIDELLNNSCKVNSGRGCSQQKEDDTKQIPFYSTQKRGLIIKGSEPSHYISVDNTIKSEQSFAVSHTGHAMFPRLVEGVILIVDRNKRPRNKDFVYVYSNNCQDYICRQFEEVDNVIYLIPFNPAFEKIKFDEYNDQIIGVIVQAKNYF